MSSAHCASFMILAQHGLFSRVLRIPLTAPEAEARATIELTRASVPAAKAANTTRASSTQWWGISARLAASRKSSSVFRSRPRSNHAPPGRILPRSVCLEFRSHGMRHGGQSLGSLILDEEFWTRCRRELSAARLTGALPVQRIRLLGPRQKRSRSCRPTEGRQGAHRRPPF